MRPVYLRPEDERWLARIRQDPDAAIFHHPAWMNMLLASYGYQPFILALTGASGQVCAGIPIAEIDKPPLPRRWVALPFSDYCQPLYQDAEDLDQLAAVLVEQRRVKGSPRLEVRAALPEQEHIQVRAPFVLHTLPLEADAARVAKRASRQQMQNVRTAEKNNIRVTRGAGLEDMRAFYHLHCLTRRRHGVPVQPWKFFQRITGLLLQQGLGFVLLAYQEDTCVSAGVFLHWQKTLTYKYSATDERFQNLRPNHLVTWTAMQWGCENGFTTFDFGRADLEDEGLRSYKRRWGANEVPLSYSYSPAAPASQAKDGGRVGNLLKEIIRRSPVWVARAIGEVAYPYAG